VTTGALPSSHGRGSLALAIALLLALVLLLPFLESVPGLHGDEAWVGLRVHALSEGYHTVYGMTPYTGSVHQYLMLPWMQLFGYRVWVLRAFTAVTSVLSVLLYFLVTRRCFDARTAGIAALLLVSMPFFTLYGRTATENFALNPVCALAGCWFILQARDRTGGARLAFGVAAGIVLGLATWSHFVFLPVPAVLGIFALARLRLQLFRSPVFLAVAAGFLLALAPRLIAQLVAPPDQNDLVVAAQSQKLWNLLPCGCASGPASSPASSTAICSISATPVRSSCPRPRSARSCLASRSSRSRCSRRATGSSAPATSSASSRRCRWSSSSLC
jgi:4-amino-4-deoxy-L-arabinose transferase-like glycosyltransferase